MPDIINFKFSMTRFYKLYTYSVLIVHECARYNSTTFSISSFSPLTAASVRICQTSGRFELMRVKTIKGYNQMIDASEIFDVASHYACHVLGMSREHSKISHV